jgi:hypothetical protein
MVKMPDYAIPIVWPGYQIATEFGQVGGLGHAGVVIVDGLTGNTRYFDYGRFGSDLGVVRTRPVSDLSIIDGVIDGNSLSKMISGLNASVGHKNVAMGTILPLSEGGYTDALNYAESAMLDPVGVLGEYSWAMDNHCYSFAKAVAAAGGSLVDWFDGFWPFDNAPSAGMTTLLEDGGFVIGGANDSVFGDALDYATPIDRDFCFIAGTMIDMWPTDPGIKPYANGLYNKAAVLAKVWQKPIEQIRPEDWVVSFDDAGNLKPGKVRRTFTNQAKIILDFFGTGVTPGHAYYRPDSRRPYKFEPLIDILRDDGVVQDSNGALVRAATGVPVGDPRDRFVWAITGDRSDDGRSVTVKAKGRIRLGTRIITDDGKDFCVDDLIKSGDGIVTDEGLIRVGLAQMPFHWTYSDTLPKAEDYVLKRSGTTLDDIYKATEWEQVRPHMPPPMVRDGGPVQPLSQADLTLMPRNTPLAMRDEGYAASSRPILNRKQRKAAEARERQQAKPKKRMLN